MKPLTEKQKKAAWIVAGLLLFIHFLPGMVRTIAQAVASRQHRVQPAMPSKVSLPAPVAVRQAAPAPPSQVLTKFAGVFEGAQFLPNNDQCRVHLEIRPSQDRPGFISGYETRSCFNVPQFVAGRSGAHTLADAMREASPVSTVMTGSPDNGDISFHVDNVIGSSPFVCPIVSYRTSVFGAKSIVAQWRAVDCPEGSIVLTRVGG